MKTITYLFCAGIFLLFGASSCIEDWSITGNGVQATENRIVTDFSKVKASGSFQVYVNYGEEYDVVVRADENLIQYVETYVSGETLNIDIDGVHNVRTVVPMEIFVTTPNLSGITQSGSGTITTDLFNADHFDVILSGSGRIYSEFESNTAKVVVSGSGKIEVSGIANVADFTVSGSGNIDASDLESLECHTLTSGSGNMWISVERRLDSRISGSGNVYYYGSPVVETNISGSGNVIHRN